jgi:hypothetical protein
MLPIEGARTALPWPLNPGDSVNVNAKIVAPATLGSFILRVSLVQEGVQWFMTAGATPLELKAIVH